MTKAMFEREKVKNGIRFAVHAWAPALDYGIYKPYYKTSRGAENRIRKCKADDRKHGWLMDYEVAELYPYQQWFLSLPYGDSYEREKNKDEVRADVYLAKLTNAMENFSAEKVEKWSDALKRKGMEFFRYRTEFCGWNIGVRKMVNR